VVLDCQDPYSTWLTIRDDGVGKEEINRGFGPLGIRERALLLGGEVSIETGPGKGFSFMVKIPL
jgi:signal transduction histidine kinase